MPDQQSRPSNAWEKSRLAAAGRAEPLQVEASDGFRKHVNHFNLPEPQPTELVDSVLLRVARLNSGGSVGQLCTYVLNEKALNGIASTKKMVMVMAKLYGWPIQRIIQRYTLIPFLDAFTKGGICWSSQLESGRFGCRRPEQSRLVRFCKKCREEDLEWHGYSFFRRHHQISSIDICSKHEEPLFQVGADAQCMLPSDKIFSLLEQLEVRTSNKAAFAAMFRRVAEDLLDVPSPNDIENVGKRLRELAKKSGFATGRPSELRAKSLGLEITNRCGAEGDWIRNALMQAAYGANPATKINFVLCGVERNATTVILTALSLTNSSDEAALLLSDRTPVAAPQNERLQDAVVLEAYFANGRNCSAAARALGRHSNSVRRRLVRLLNASCA